MDEPQESAATPAEPSPALAPEATAPDPEMSAETISPVEPAAGVTTPPEVGSISEPSAPIAEMPQPTPPVTAEPIPPVEAPVLSPPSASPQSHSASPAAAVNRAKESAAKSVQSRKQKVERHLAKILTIARERGRIANRNVVSLLRVSDSTASRYLKMLVSRGQLQKTGKGRNVTYQSI